MKKLLVAAERIEDVIENNFFRLANIGVTSDRLWLGRHYRDWMQQHPRFNLSELELSPSAADLSSAKLKSQPTNAVRNFGGFGGSLIIVVVSLSESNVDFISNFCRRTFRIWPYPRPPFNLSHRVFISVSQFACQFV